MSEDTRTLLLSTAEKLKRRGLDQNLEIGHQYFPEEELHLSEIAVDSGLRDRQDYSKARVWLKISDFSWISGTIESLDERLTVNFKSGRDTCVKDHTVNLGRNFQILTDEGTRTMVSRKSGNLSRRLPVTLETVDNLILLPDLDEPNIFHVVVERYLKSRHPGFVNTLVHSFDKVEDACVEARAAEYPSPRKPAGRAGFVAACCTRGQASPSS